MLLKLVELLKCGVRRGKSPWCSSQEQAWCEPMQTPAGQEPYHHSDFPFTASCIYWQAVSIYIYWEQSIPLGAQSQLGDDHARIVKNDIQVKIDSTNALGVQKLLSLKRRFVIVQVLDPTASGVQKLFVEGLLYRGWLVRNLLVTRHQKEMFWPSVSEMLLGFRYAPSSRCSSCTAQSVKCLNTF